MLLFTETLERNKQAFLSELNSGHQQRAEERGDVGVSSFYNEMASIRYFHCQNGERSVF